MDFVRCIISAFLLVVMSIEIRQRYKLSGDLFNSVFTLKFLLNSFTIFIFGLGLFFRIFFLNYSTVYFLRNRNNFIDTFKIASVYNQNYFYESLLFFLISLKVTIFLKLNDYIRLFYSTLESGMISFVKYSFFFLLIIFGYTIVSYQIWGPYMEGFSTIEDAFQMTLLFSMGNKEKKDF